jgi:hypothetical protein
MAQFEYTFPQDWGTGSHPQYEGDPNDAANFGSLIGATSPVSALIRGINFTVDYANNTVDTTEGKVYLVGDNITAGTSQTERDEVAFVNGLKAKTGLTLSDAAVNHVYVATDPTTNNEPRVEINDTGSAPADPSLKVGEIDTSAGTKSEQWNLIAGNGMLTYPDNTALLASASRFENGVPLFDRAAEEVSVVDSSGVSRIGVTDHANLSNITADDHHAKTTSGDIDHDQTVGGTDADAHHADPTAGTGITDEGTNQFGISTNGVGKDEFDAAEYVIDHPNVTLPLTALENGESIEKFVRIEAGETLTVYKAEAVSRASGKITNLSAEVIDENDTVQNTFDGTNESTSGLASFTNSSGAAYYYGLRIINNTGSPIDSPGAFGNFGVVVE